MSPENESNIKLHFVRHGDPDRTANIPVKDFPLLEESKVDIDNLRNDMKISHNTALGFSGDNKRSIDTVEILVSSKEKSVDDKIEAFKKKFKVRVLLFNSGYIVDGYFETWSKVLELGWGSENIVIFPVDIINNNLNLDSRISVYNFWYEFIQKNERFILGK